MLSVQLTQSKKICFYIKVTTCFPGNFVGNNAKDFPK